MVFNFYVLLLYTVYYVPALLIYVFYYVPFSSFFFFSEKKKTGRNVKDMVYGNLSKITAMFCQLLSAADEYYNCFLGE